jgi:hypothetical protein
VISDDGLAMNLGQEGEGGLFLCIFGFAFYFGTVVHASLQPPKPLNNHNTQRNKTKTKPAASSSCAL